MDAVEPIYAWCEQTVNPGRTARWNVPNERDYPDDNETTGPDRINPDRLIEVATAVYDACQEWSTMHGGRSIAPTKLLGSADQPKSMTEFTRFEVEEAEMFLIRMGFMQPPSAKTR